jgi:putative NADH-flavin reductase
MVMRVAIFGAHGPTGQLLTRDFLDAGHDAVAITRHPDDFPLTAPN